MCEMASQSPSTFFDLLRRIWHHHNVDDIDDIVYALGFEDLKRRRKEESKKYFS